MKDLVNFSFGSTSVRTITDNKSVVWFVASDVAVALGYTDVDQAIRKHCKNPSTMSRILPVETTGKIHGASKLIEETDLYRLMFGSTLDSAERFRDWVMEEVLPQIRRTGKYAPTPKQLYLEKLDAVTESITELAKIDPKSLIKAARTTKHNGCNIDFLSTEIKDKIEPVSTWGLSRIYGVSETRMNKLLEYAGLQTNKHVLTDKGREFGHVVYEELTERPILTVWLPETADYVRLNA